MIITSTAHVLSYSKYTVKNGIYGQSKKVTCRFFFKVLLITIKFLISRLNHVE